MNVDPERERRIGQVLGLTRDEAVSVVSVLQDQDWLKHGVVTGGMALAARWGVELLEGLQAVAGGRRLGPVFSDYELRVAAEEAESDLPQLWADGVRDISSDFEERLLPTQRMEIATGLVESDHVPQSSAYIDVPAMDGDQPADS